MTIIEFIEARIAEEPQPRARALACLLGEIADYEARIDGEWGCLHTAPQILAGRCTRHEDIPAFVALATLWAGHPDYQPLALTLPSSWPGADPSGARA